MIAHAKMVNYEGSYYMRTVQWDIKDKMVVKLASVVGAPAYFCIAPQRTWRYS